MDHTTLFEAVKALAPDMEICVGVEVWGNSKGCYAETTWQIYLSVPGTFFRGATPEAAFEAFKAVYGPKPTDPVAERERLIDLAVGGLISSRQDIDAGEAMELGAQLSADKQLDPQVCEHLLFWYSRMFPDTTGKAEPIYRTWLAGAAQGKPLDVILTELAPAEKVVDPSPAEA